MFRPRPWAALPFLFASLIALASGKSAIQGQWITIDDESGKPKSIVEIYETDTGLLEGRVVEILHSDRGPNPLCVKCPGERRNQPIKGMVILWDLQPSVDGECKGGHILDPMNGRTYRARLRLRADGKLDVRGYIGISLLGRTQVWEPAAGGSKGGS